MVHNTTPEHDKHLQRSKHELFVMFLIALHKSSLDHSPFDYREHKSETCNASKRARRWWPQSRGAQKCWVDCAAREAPRRPLPTTWLMQLPGRPASRVPNLRPARCWPRWQRLVYSSWSFFFFSKKRRRVEGSKHPTHAWDVPFDWKDLIRRGILSFLSESNYLYYYTAASAAILG